MAEEKGWALSVQLNKYRALLLAIVLLLLYGGIVAAASWTARQDRISQLEAPLRGRATANAEVISRRIDDLRRDVVFLSAVPPISGIVRASANNGYDTRERSTTALWNNRLVTIFSAYVKAHPEIAQARFIGMAGNGRELVRVEQGGDAVIVSPAAQLQEKGSSAYVRETARLPPGATYVSSLDLNREHGKVQLPPQPMLRVATPVYADDGKVFGVIVINFRPEKLLQSISANLPSYFIGYLINGDGDFLMHPDPQRTFGFDLGRRWRWQDQFPALADATTQGHMQQLAGTGGDRYAVAAPIVLDAQQRQRDLRYVLTNSGVQVVEAGQNAARNAALSLTLATLLMAGVFMLYHRQRRQARQHEQYVSAIVDNSNDAIIGQALDGRVLSWNHGAEQMFGYSTQAACGRLLVELIVPAGSEHEEADILQRIGQGERISDFSTTRRRNNGSVLPVVVNSSPIMDARGRIVGAAKIVRDVSSQVAATRRIEEMNTTLELQVRLRTEQIESVTRLQTAILSNAPYAILATDPQGVIRLFNPAAERMLGYTAAEMLGQQTPAVLHDDAELGLRAALNTAALGTPVAAGFDAVVAKARRDSSDEAQWTYVRKDGSQFPVMLSTSPLRGEHGELSGFLCIAADISVREQDRRTLVAARDQLLNASNVAQLGIWSWTLEGNLLEWNERMFALYDLPLSERAGGLSYEHWRSRVHPDDVERVAGLLQEAVAGRAVYDPEFRVCHRDGSVRYVQAAASVERDGNGQAVRVLGINRDVTLQHEAEAALLAAKLAADDANRAKSAFLANMSHEIRSPMNAVLGMLTLLQRTTLDRRQQDYATKAETAGRALLGILNDILDFSKVEAGKLALDPQPFSIDQLLRDVAVILSANVGDKPVEILYQVAPDLPSWVLGDGMRLQQILINLAGNAVKFTAKGEVVLSVNLLPPPADAVAAEPDLLCLGFAIRDTGIGISAEQRERIFDGFSQAEASTARRFGGSGLGLAISRRLIDLMDGALSVESELGRGSTFRFHIHCRRASPPAAERLDNGILSQRLRCLVVDDHAAARASMSTMLASFGWQVDTAANGEAALALLQQQSAPVYDALFVDWEMPGINGWETAERIKQQGKLVPDCIVVMVTAHERQALAEHQARSPALINAVIMKPVTPSSLFDTVADAIAGGGGQPVSMPEPALRPRPQPLAGLRLLVVEDNQVNQQVARELLQGEGASVTTASDGQLALDVLAQAEQRFDCVLMDLQMPNMDGYTATRRIRQQPGLQQLPIIAMTANAMSSDRQLALEAGMDDHIGKPFDLTQLVNIILQYSGRQTLAPSMSDAAQSAQRLRRPGFNGDAALARFGNQINIYLPVLHKFSAEIAVLMAALPDEMPQQGSGAAAATMHSLKGMAATVGAEQLADSAVRVEKALRSATLSDWQLNCMQLRQAGASAAQAAAEIAMLLEASMPASVESASGDLARLPHALLELQMQLEASSTDALPLFDALLRDFGMTMPHDFAELKSRIEQFDFAAAAQQCRQLQQQFADMH